MGVLFLFLVDGLEHERCNSIAIALELRLSYTNPSMWYSAHYQTFRSRLEVFVTKSSMHSPQIITMPSDECYCVKLVVSSLFKLSLQKIYKLFIIVTLSSLFIGDRWIPSQRSSDAENVFTPWPHRANGWNLCNMFERSGNTIYMQSLQIRNETQIRPHPWYVTGI